MPKVSVIMPVFNCEAFVEAAVRSVIAQTERDLELVVVDDGSTDSTVAILRQMADHDPRISIHSQPHSGKPAVARNSGMARACGEYLTFLDGDDLYHPTKLQHQLQCFERRPDLDIVFHDHRRFGSGRNQPATLRSKNYVERAGSYLTCLGNNMFLCREDFHKFISLEIVGIVTCSIMFRRALLQSEKQWFRDDLRVGEDHDLWLRLTKGRRLAYLDEVLSSYRIREGSVTFSGSADMHEDAIQPHLDNLRREENFFSSEEIQRYKKRIGGFYFELGYAAFRESQRRRARRAYVRSMLLRPGAKTLTAWLKTFAPGFLVQSRRRKELRNGREAP